MRRTRRSFHPTADRLLLPLEFLIRAVSFDGSRVARSTDSPNRDQRDDLNLISRRIK